MKLSYDPRYNIAYLHLREKAVGIETIRISDELNVDLSPDGKVYGIEFLNANEQLQRPTSFVLPLSSRETEILRYMAQGYLNKQIAEALDVSEQTVKKHIGSILRKLDIDAHTQAIEITSQTVEPATGEDQL